MRPSHLEQLSLVPILHLIGWHAVAIQKRVAFVWYEQDALIFLPRWRLACSPVVPVVWIWN